MECAALWPSCWQTIMDIINYNLQWEMDNHYKKTERKTGEASRKTQHLHAQAQGTATHIISTDHQPN